MYANLHNEIPVCSGGSAYGSKGRNDNNDNNNDDSNDDDNNNNSNNNNLNQQLVGEVAEM